MARNPTKAKARGQGKGKGKDSGKAIKKAYEAGSFSQKPINTRPLIRGSEEIRVPGAFPELSRASSVATHNAAHKVPSVSSSAGFTDSNGSTLHPMNDTFPKNGKPLTFSAKGGPAESNAPSASSSRSSSICNFQVPSVTDSDASTESRRPSIGRTYRVPSPTESNTSTRSESFPQGFSVPSPPPSSNRRRFIPPRTVPTNDSRPIKEHLAPIGSIHSPLRNASRTKGPTASSLGLTEQQKELERRYPNPEREPFPTRVPAHPENLAKPQVLVDIPGYKYPHTFSFVEAFTPKDEALLIEAWENVNGTADSNALKIPPVSSFCTSFSDADARVEEPVGGWKPFAQDLVRMGFGKLAQALGLQSPQPTPQPSPAPKRTQAPEMAEVHKSSPIKRPFESPTPQKETFNSPQKRKRANGGRPGAFAPRKPLAPIQEDSDTEEDPDMHDGFAPTKGYNHTSKFSAAAKMTESMQRRNTAFGPEFEIWRGDNGTFYRKKSKFHPDNLKIAGNDDAQNGEAEDDDDDDDDVGLRIKGTVNKKPRHDRNQSGSIPELNTSFGSFSISGTNPAQAALDRGRKALNVLQKSMQKQMEAGGNVGGLDKGKQKQTEVASGQQEERPNRFRAQDKTQATHAQRKEASKTRHTRQKSKIGPPSKLSRATIPDYDGFEVLGIARMNLGS